MHGRNRYIAMGVALGCLGVPGLVLGAGLPQNDTNLSQSLPSFSPSSDQPQGAPSAPGSRPGLSHSDETEINPVSGSILIGGGYLNKDSYKYGEWTGVVGKGGYALFGLNVGQLPAWESTDPHYWDLKASNLGLASRAVSLQGGKLGKYKVEVSYQGIPHYEWQDAKTPYTQVGKDYLKLPANFGGLDPSSESAWEQSVTNNLDPNLHDVNLKTYRSITKVRYSANLTENWSVLAQFRHDEKHGRIDFGSAINGGEFSPASVLVPMPIDYKINQIRLQNDYHTGGLNMAVAYLGSFYNDELSHYTWDSAYTSAGEPDWIGNSTYPGGKGMASTPPDNMFNQGIFSGSWSTPYHSTHVVWDAAYGLESQSANFLPYTINSGITINHPLPALNANAQVKTTQANLRIVTSPVERMEVVGSFRYHDHADNSSTYEFYPVTADAGDQATTAFRNLPYSYRRETAKLNMQYNFGKVRPFFKYQYQEYNRKFVAVGTTQSNDFTGGVHVDVGTIAQMRLSGHYGRRHGSFYRGSYATQLQETGVYDPAGDTNPQANTSLWTWNPLQRMFWFADRTRRGGQASVDITPPGPVTVSLDAQYNYDNYSDSQLGLLSNRNQTYSIDIGYNPVRHVSMDAYGTYQRLNWDQGAIYFPGFNPSQAFNFNDYWHLANSEPMYVAGLNIKAKELHVGLPNPIELAFNASYSYSSAGMTMTTGSALTSSAGSFPDLAMHMVHLGINGTYNFTQRLGMQLGVAWERYRSNNWHLDGVMPGTITDEPVVSMGVGSPNYTVTWTTLALNYRF